MLLLLFLLALICSVVSFKNNKWLHWSFVAPKEEELGKDKLVIMDVLNFLTVS